MMKPGVKTTEFWVVMALLAAGVGLALAGNPMAEALIGAAVAQGANYGRGRQAQKEKNGA